MGEMSSDDYNQIDLKIALHDYQTAQSMLSYIYTQSPSIEQRVLLDLNRHFISALMDSQDTSSFIKTFQSLCIQVWNFIPFKMDLFISIMLNAVFILGLRHDVLNMNQFVQSVITRIQDYYHLETNDLEMVLKCIDVDIPQKHKHFLDFLFFVIAVNKRYTTNDLFTEKAIAYLSTHYHLYSLLQKAYLHFLNPQYYFTDFHLLPSSWHCLYHETPSSWVSFYHAIQANELDQANQLLLEFSKQSTVHPSVLLYNLILLATETQFHSLLPLFLSSLSTPWEFHHYPLFHPHALPVTPQTSWLAEQVLVKACHAKTDLSLLQSLLQHVSVSNWSSRLSLLLSMYQLHPIQDEQLDLLRCSLHPLDRVLYFYSQCYNHLQQHQLEQAKAVLSDLENAVAALPVELHKLYQLFSHLLRMLEFSVHQNEMTSLALQRMVEIQPCASDESLYSLPYSPATIYMYNVCIGLLQKQDCLRCCILWCRYWRVDLLLIVDPHWVAERVKTDEDWSAGCCSSWNQLVELDLFVMDYWKKRLENKTLLNQVMALQSRF